MRRTRRNSGGGIELLIILVLAAVALAPFLGLYYCFKCSESGGKVVGAFLAVLGFCGWVMFSGEYTDGLVFVLLAELILAVVGWGMLAAEKETKDVSRPSRGRRKVTSEPARPYGHVDRDSDWGSFDPMEDLEGVDTAEDFYLFNQEEFTNFAEAEETFDELDD